MPSCQRISPDPQSLFYWIIAYFSVPISILASLIISVSEGT